MATPRMYTLLARDKEVSDEDNSDQEGYENFDTDCELDPPSSPEAASNQSTSTPVSANRRVSAIRDVTNTIPVNQSQLILDEIRKANSRLDEFGETLHSVQRRLQEVEKDLTSMGPSSSADTSIESPPKAKIPKKVRHEVRDIYKVLLDEEENNFEGFDFKKKYSDIANQAIVRKLINEMKNLEPGVPPTQVKDSARRFFQSKLEEASLKRTGKYDAKVTRQRRQNRIVRKFQVRKAAFLKCSVSEQQRSNFNKVLSKEFISSEESATEIVEGKEQTVLNIKPLPWRSAKVGRFFKKLDDRVAKTKKSRKSIQQTLPRVLGAPSSRLKPLSFPDDFWGFVQDDATAL